MILVLRLFQPLKKTMTYDLNNPPKEYLDSFDAINDAQDNALSALRERIKAKQVSVFEVKPIENPFPVKERELIDVPQVNEPDEPEFSLNRHAEIIFRLEALYNNYLYRLNALKAYPTVYTIQEEFESALKELCRAQEQLLKETTKPRF